MKIEEIVLNLTHRKCVDSLCQRFLHLRQRALKRVVKSVFEVPDTRCVCAHNISSSVLKVTSLSSSATFREQ